MNHYLLALLFFLPAGFANAFPPIANKIPFINKWKTPLDLGKKYKGKRIFGANKTYRGLITGSIIGGLSAIVIKAIFPHEFVGFTSHLSFENFILGTILGFGALLGDAIESFFKRQSGINSGESWLFFDQIDYVLGAIIFSIPFARFTLDQYAFVILSLFGLHLLVSYIGFLLGFKDKPI